MKNNTIKIIREKDYFEIRKKGYEGPYDDPEVIYSTSPEDCEESFNYMSNLDDSSIIKWVDKNIYFK